MTYTEQLMMIRSGLSPKTTGAKPKKPIEKVSVKRKQENKELKKIAKSKGELCQINSPECTGKSQGTHHLVKRSPKNLLDPANILLACNPCNSYIESHVTWAKEKGFTKTKFK